MPDVGTLPVISLDVLNADECARWSERVLALKSHWTARDPDLPFFTLGLAAYCDASPDEVGAPYRVESYRQWNNRLLVKHFGALLEQCCQALASATGVPAACPGGHAAVPGFHIHLPHPVFAKGIASQHVDLQFQRVFGGIDPDPGAVLTFTLPISMPAGAALRIWQSEHQSAVYPYQLGKMTIHSGLSLHQAVINPHDEPVPRIMLQGHGLRHEERWSLYW
jgi:hypothetical protein